jgi:hypothetical protein
MSTRFFRYEQRYRNDVANRARLLWAQALEGLRASVYAMVVLAFVSPDYSRG